MSEFKALSAELSVAGQLTPEDLEAAARAGFRTVINNRPDNEDGNQPEDQALRAVAQRLGLQWRYLPVVSGNITDRDVDEFNAALAGSPAPVLAFCRTGTRCTMLWALSQAQRRPLEEILGSALRAGYDLSGLRPRLQERHQDPS